MDYQVTFVTDDALPKGVDYAFARQAGATWLFVKLSAIGAASGRCDVLCRAWKTWQNVESRGVPSHTLASA